VVSVDDSDEVTYCLLDKNFSVIGKGDEDGNVTRWEFTLRGWHAWP
jgi:hypothetical protein